MHHERVLIGPCGIETSKGFGSNKVFPKVLIGPCGIETLIKLRLNSRRFVLIGPCGIETEYK